jgi:hypothetical protein
MRNIHLMAHWKHRWLRKDLNLPLDCVDDDAIDCPSWLMMALQPAVIPLSRLIFLQPIPHRELHG